VPYVGFAFTDAALDFLEALPPKIRKQVIKKAKALHTEPHPPGSKKLHDVETAEGDPVYRERSGDYRILYIVRSNPAEVLILDIDDRKDIYRMMNTKPKTEPAGQMRMKEADFDAIMSRALGVAAPTESDSEAKSNRRLSSYPPKKNRAKS